MTFLQNLLLFHGHISAVSLIKHDQEYLLEHIQPQASLLDFRFRARTWFIVRIGH